MIVTSPPALLFASCVVVSIALNILSLILHRRLKKSHEKPGLFIESAQWGPRPEDVKDVTGRVRKSFEQHGEVEPSTYVLKDPFKGEVKYLWVTYSITKPVVQVREEQHPTLSRLKLDEDKEQIRIYRGN